MTARFKHLMGAAIVGAASLVSLPASAAVLVCTEASCFGSVDNVLINGGVGSTATGNIGVNTVVFSSTTDTTLVASANGQAKVGAYDGLLNDLSFSLSDIDGQSFGFSRAVFNLVPLPGNQQNEATNIFLNFTLSDGTTNSIAYTIAKNGENFIGLYGDDGEIFKSVGFSANPSTTGIREIRQVRLGEIAPISGAVPEPSTWALMLLGFGVVGAAMRSRKAASKVSYAA